MSLLDALLLDPAPFHIWVAVRSDLQRGSGTVSDPFHGGMLAGISQFDTIMNLAQVAQSNVVVHLGPGTYKTKGYADGVAGGWQIKTGMKILGSGIDVSVIQLDNAGVTAGKHYFAIAHSLGAGNKVDAAEVTDLTVDCNCGGATASAFGGIRLLGNNAQVRRVKLINWGTLSATVPAFGVVCLTGDIVGGVFGVDNTGIEDCYAMAPFTAGPSTSIATAFAIGDWGYAAITTREAEGKSPFIRKCYVDGGNTFAPQPSFNITTPARSTIVATAWAWCRGGVIEGNQIYNVDIGGPYQSQRTVQDGIVRNNFMKNVAAGVWLSAGQITTNDLLTSATLNISAGIGTVSSASPTVSVLALASGDRVRLTNGAGTPTFDGVFVVNSVNTGGNQFTIRTTHSTTPVSLTELFWVRAVGRAIIEGNTIELPTSAVPASGTPNWPSYMGILVRDNQTTPKTPDYVLGEVILRGNKVRLLDGVEPVSTNAAYGADIQGAKNVQVSQSILGVFQGIGAPQPQQNTRCGNVTYFNNRQPQGTLIQGFNVDNSKRYDELDTLTEDAFVMAFLQE